MAYLRKYGVGSGADVYIPLIKRGVVDFAVTADFTPASGDVKISIDGGSAANIGTLPVVNGTHDWKFVFSDAELQGKVIRVRIVDSATKAVEDQSFTIETYGHASAMYQADLSAANLPANVIQAAGTAWGSGAITAAAIADDAITAAKIATGAIDADAIADNAIDAGAIATDAITSAKIATGAITSGNFAAGAITSSAFAAGAITSTVIAADAIGASELAADAVAEIADAVWDEATTSHTTSGTFGEQLKTDVDAILDDTNELQTDWVNGGRLDLILDIIAADTTTDIPGLIAALNNLSAAGVRTELATELARIDAAVSTRATPAQVNEQVLDVLNVDTFAEPGQGAPAATASLVAKIGYLYKAWRNKRTQTATTQSIYDDAGTTVDQKATVSDDGTTFTKNEVASGP